MTPEQLIDLARTDGYLLILLGLLLYSIYRVAKWFAPLVERFIKKQEEFIDNCTEMHQTNSEAIRQLGEDIRLLVQRDCEKASKTRPRRSQSRLES